MMTRHMSELLKGDALPGACIGYVGDLLISERDDLRESRFLQVRAPISATGEPGQPVECWLVSGVERPDSDGARRFATVLLNDQEAQRC